MLEKLMLLSGVMLAGFTSLNAQKVRISTPDSVNAVVIDYKVLPPANAENVPQDFNVGKKEYYYVIWDHYIICCDPDQYNSYELYDTKKQVVRTCTLEDTVLWVGPARDYGLEYQVLEVNRNLVDTIQGYPVYRCRTREKDHILTAWHTDLFGPGIGLKETLPGIPLYYEFPVKDGIARVSAVSIDTERIAKRYFDIEHMETLLPMEIPVYEFGYRKDSFRKPIQMGERMPSIRGKIVSGEKLHIDGDHEKPTVYIFFAAQPGIGVRFGMLNKLISDFGDAVHFIAITPDSFERARSLLKIFPLNCPVLANGSKHLIRLGYRHTYFCILADSQGYVKKIILHYPNRLEDTLRAALERM